MTEQKKAGSATGAKTRISPPPIKPKPGIYSALAEFQFLCPPLKKDAKADVTTLKGGKYSYNYGSLPRMLEHIKPHMKAAGLMHTQPIVFEDGHQYLVTKVFHVETLESIESKMLIPEVEFTGMNIFQSMGSGITYLRKYSLKSILGISEDEDDNDAAGAAVQKPKAASKSKSNPKSDSKVEKPWLNPEVGGALNPTWADAVRFLAGDGTLDQIKAKYRMSGANEEKIKNEALEYSEASFNQMPKEDPGPPEQDQPGPEPGDDPSK